MPSSVALAVHATQDALRKASLRLRRPLHPDLAAQKWFRYLRHRFYFSVSQTAPDVLHRASCPLHCETRSTCHSRYSQKVMATTTATISTRFHRPDCFLQTWRFRSGSDTSDIASTSPKIKRYTPRPAAVGVVCLLCKTWGTYH